ncbi:hypothetical protein HK102_002390 [Quaeritorhiza haematococci]|nr:hypothetical protein HK102_002390 [Quaeritorhiza haematococci]
MPPTPRKPSSISRYLLSPSAPLYTLTTALILVTSIHFLTYGGLTLPFPTTATTDPARLQSTTLTILIVSCIWLGFVLSISFMEAWVKFHAPTPSRSHLLDVGRHVFSALNKVEVVVAVGMLYLNAMRLATVGETNLSGGWKAWVWVIPPLITLGLQTFWLYPALRERATEIITKAGEASGKGSASAAGAGAQVAKPWSRAVAARAHVYYSVLEVMKVAALGVLVGEMGREVLAAGERGA